MTDILHITDRERTQAAVILALESARDEMAKRIEALTAPGYVLVPTEATEALLGRLMDAVWRTTHGDADITKEEARGIYRAMIAAGDKP